MQEFQTAIEEDYLENRDFARLIVGKQGQFFIPSEMLNALGFKEGQKVIARNENGRLVIETKEQVEERLHARFSHLKDRSLSEELIQERREAAKREAEA